MPHVYRLLIAGLLWLNQSAVTEDKNFRVVDVMTGNADEQPAGGVWMADSNDRWANLWSTVFGVQVMGNHVSNLSTFEPARPSVDFKNDVVIGLVAQNVRNSQGFDVVGYSAKGETVIIRLRNKAPSIELTQTLTTPYIFMVVTRTLKQIEVQIPGVDRDRQPIWKTVATFPATLEDSMKP